MQNKLNFKISAALKDIIGRDLITDDYIAVFELVKNSFDAHATKVDIIFENIHSVNSKIIIRDNGKGMSIEDIENKWLFVAYSAKKDKEDGEVLEDRNYDYREHLNANRAFAGAKGIGRFSCDKLGRRLLLETKKNSPNSTYEVLLTDWEKFEENLKDEFIDITVLHETIEKSNFDLLHGTVLEITDLRESWNRKKILKLKDSLSKLINPQDIDIFKKFEIYIHAKEELSNDEKENDYFNKVNGKVENFIFSTIELKTTKIKSKIDVAGTRLTTELYDGGTLIYKITEPNTFATNDSFKNVKLTNCSISLYYLNKSAKMTFARRMGVPVVNYGHVFLYRNGFRVYPYGEPGEDSFKIDVRKGQGYNRYLGTREIIGHIEIFSDVEEEEVKETSSRGDGLKKTSTYYLIEECFKETLRKLEKYVVDIQRWGLGIEDNPSSDLRERITDFIAKISGTTEILDFEVSEDFFYILETSQSESAEAIVKNLSKIALETKNDRIIEQSQKAIDAFKKIKKAKEEAELEAIEEQKKANLATEQLRQQIGENLFLKSISTSDFKEVISLLHHVGIYAGTIDNNLKGISLRLQNNIPLSNQEIYDIIKKISFETKKILNIASFATKANFNLQTEFIEVDIVNYISEYIKNIIPSTLNKSINIALAPYTNKTYIKKIKPIELNIIIDNLISNSKKAKAKNLILEFYDTDRNSLEVKFIDDGIGILPDLINRVFDFGFTTTDGSGIGLYHVKEIMNSLRGSTKISNNAPNPGVTFTLEFK